MDGTGVARLHLRVPLHVRLPCEDEDFERLLLRRESVATKECGGDEWVDEFYGVIWNSVRVVR